MDRDPIGSSIGQEWLLFTSTSMERAQFSIVSLEIGFGFQLSFYALGSA